MLSTPGWLNTRLSRRTVLVAGASAVLASGLARPAVASPPLEAPFIHPRDDWAAGREPIGRLEAEEPGGARFLLVHHSASPNGDTPDQIPGRIRSFFDYHTQTKGWPDVAYNFFVDPFGGLWEGRQGSLTSPVKGDATGGSQGFAVLCCFIGDFSSIEPSPEAMEAAAHLLAWQAATYRIDLSEGSQVRFVSRGSTLWSAGTEVATDPIAGHRDMSQTTCPGDALYPQVRAQLWPDARALVAASQPSQAPTPSVASVPTEQTVPLPTPDPTPAGDTPASAGSSPSPRSTDSTSPGSGSGWLLPAGLAATAAGAGALAWASRFMRPQPPRQSNGRSQ